MIIPKYLSSAFAILAVWSVVLMVVLLVDPATIKDLPIKDLYLPMLLLVAGASGLTSLLLVRTWLVAIITGLLIGLGMVLLILRVFTNISGVAIVTGIVAMHYFVIKVHSTHR